MSKAKKPTVLRNLNIKSVSVVDQGANQHAHIKLAKRAEEEPETPDMNTEEKPVENDTAFFTRLGQAIAKMFRMAPDETEAVEKEAKTFATIDGARKTFERIYRISDALGDSLRSIVTDEELNDEQKAAMIVQTADQAASAIKTDIAAMFNGTAVNKGETDETGNKGVGEEPNPEAQTTEQPTESTPAENKAEENPIAKINDQEGETDMKFNTEAMTPEERAQLEDLQKRFGVDEEAPAAPAAAPAPSESENSDDIYKGLHPAVKAEMESLRKFREEAEEREVMDVAKRYTIIGKKPEELAPVLKSLKAAGGTAYADMIALLDSAKDMVEKSGVFGEIGKRGNAGNSADDAWAQIEAAADEIAKSNVGMTRAQAIEKACDAHPELVRDYENSRK